MKKNSLFDPPARYISLILGFIGAIFFFLGGFMFWRTKMPHLWAFIILGLLFLIASIILQATILRKDRAKRRLMKRSPYVDAKIISIHPDLKVRHIGSPTFVVVAEYKGQGGIPYTYKSENLPVNPTPSIVTDSVRVYIDENDPSNYYMDLDSAKEEVIYL